MFQGTSETDKLSEALNNCDYRVVREWVTKPDVNKPYVIQPASWLFPPSNMDEYRALRPHYSILMLVALTSIDPTIHNLEAKQREKLELLGYLISLGADLSYKTSLRTALECAVSVGDVDAVDFLATIIARESVREGFKPQEQIENAIKLVRLMQTIRAPDNPKASPSSRKARFGSAVRTDASRRVSSSTSASPQIGAEEFPVKTETNPKINSASGLVPPFSLSAGWDDRSSSVTEVLTGGIMGSKHFSGSTANTSAMSGETGYNTVTGLPSADLPTLTLKSSVSPIHRTPETNRSNYAQLMLIEDDNLRLILQILKGHLSQMQRSLPSPRTALGLFPSGSSSPQSVASARPGSAGINSTGSATVPPVLLLNSGLGSFALPVADRSPGTSSGRSTATSSSGASSGRSMGATASSDQAAVTSDQNEDGTSLNEPSKGCCSLT